MAILAVAGNVFTRNVLGYSLFGSEELARFAFLWVIWLGVSLAVKRGAVTVITLRRRRRPGVVDARGADLRGDEPGDAARVRLHPLDPVRDRLLRELGRLAGACTCAGSTRSSR